MENLETKQKIKIAVVGCLHGQFENVYKDIQKHEKETNTKIDIVLCCGDFQVI